MSVALEFPVPAADGGQPSVPARSVRRPASPRSAPPPARPAAGRDPTDPTHPTAGSQAGGSGGGGGQQAPRRPFQTGVRHERERCRARRKASLGGQRGVDPHRGRVESSRAVGAAGSGADGTPTVRMVVQAHARFAVVMGEAAVTAAAASAVTGMAVGGIGQTVHMASGGTSPPGGGTAPQGGMPQIGHELGRGAEGVVYENLDQPGWLVKEFHKRGTSPLQARNEFQNLERARAIRPDNVVKAQAPAHPRQGFLVKEQVIPDTPRPADRAALRQIEQDLINGGVQEVGGNLMFGHTAGNPTPRWMLIE